MNVKLQRIFSGICNGFNTVLLPIFFIRTVSKICITMQNLQYFNEVDDYFLS